MTSEPKYLGVKIGTPDEVLWTNVKKAAEDQKKNAEESIKVQTEVILMAERKIKEEKDKLL